jgi:hypothetical protein
MVNPDSGTGDGTIEVSIDIAGLTEGVYIDTVTVADPEAANSPQTALIILTISDIAFGNAIMCPEAQYVIRAYSIDPLNDTIYIGDFDAYPVSDIDSSDVLVNDSISPLSTAIIPSHPDFTGEVMEIIIEARPFILGYGILYDTTVQEFMVSGSFADQTVFEANGEVTFYGHISGDVNRDGNLNLGDPVFIIKYVFNGGPPPYLICIGDTNGDGSTNIGDAVHLIRYIFMSGPKPVEGCNL